MESSQHSALHIKMASTLTREQKIAFNEAVRAAKASEQCKEWTVALTHYEHASAIFSSQQSLLQKMAYLRHKCNESSAAADFGAENTTDKRSDSVLLVAGAAEAANLVVNNDIVSNTEIAVAGAETKLAATVPAPVGAGAAPADSDDDDIVIVSSQGTANSKASGFTLSAANRDLGREEEVVISEWKSNVNGSSDSPKTASISNSYNTQQQLQQPTVDGYVIDEISSMATLPGGFRLPTKLFQMLYPYQRMGVAWMWSLHGAAPVPLGSLGRDGDELAAQNKPDGGGFSLGGATSARDHNLNGGILADDMGEDSIGSCPSIGT